MVVNGPTPSSARSGLSCRATMRSSEPSVSARAIRSRRWPTLSWRGRRPRPNGGASREVIGTAETRETAQGRPERSAAAAAPQEPSSMKSASGCSASIVAARSVAWSRARSPNCRSPDMSAPNFVRAFQSSGLKRAIGAARGSACSPIARRRSMSSMPALTVRW